VALNLFGVTVSDAHLAHVKVADVETIVVRELAAICGVTEYRAPELDEAAIARLNSVVTAFATSGPVLPAPAGVVFRATDTVERWLELHYGALTEALSFVDNRIAARVHISRPAVRDAQSADVDADAVAAEVLRALRRAAVATLPLRAERTPGAVLSAAFLVEQDLWKQFVDEVDAQSRLAIGVHLDLSGPWPPFDFVQMQLGG
jgi:hypothetical protein